MTKPKTAAYPTTPELDRMSKVKDKSQIVGEFMDWLRDTKGLTFAKYHEHGDDCWALHEHDDLCIPKCKAEREMTCGVSEERLLPYTLNMERVLAEFFDINLDRAEKEKRSILEHIRATQK